MKYAIIAALLVVAFVAGAVCGVIARPSDCGCESCRRERWMAGGDPEEP
jgi:hypothetical protein